MKRIQSFILLASIIIAPAIIPVSAHARSVVRVEQTVSVELPRGAVEIKVGSNQYHFHRGVYYRRAANGFVIVKAPRGALIRKLPRGYARVRIGGNVYFRCGDVYYRKNARGYIVVDRPVISRKRVAVIVR